MALPLRQQDDSWRMAGCGERCRLYYITASGKSYPEQMVSHDPHHHEAYGKAVLARTDALLAGRIVRTGNLEITGDTYAVKVDGRAIHLSPREAGILFCLADRIGQVVLAHDVLRTAWGPEYVCLDSLMPFAQRSAETHLIRVTLSRLRGKLGTARGLVETIAGRGYLLLQEEPVASHA